MDALTKHEIEMLAGRREDQRGAVVAMCLDYLRRRGYCTPGPNSAITSGGWLLLPSGMLAAEQMPVRRRACPPRRHAVS